MTTRQELHARDVGLLVVQPQHSAYFVQISVLSVDQQVEEQIELVTEIVETGEINAGQGNALSKKLSEIQLAADDGKTKRALNQLNAFTNQVADLVASGELTELEGQLLLDAAVALAVSLGTTSS